MLPAGCVKTFYLLISGCYIATQYEAFLKLNYIVFSLLLLHFHVLIILLISSSRLAIFKIHILSSQVTSQR